MPSACHVFISFVMAWSCVLPAAAAPAYQVVDRIALGGVARWDYLFMDSPAERLYVSHGDQTEVIDTRSHKRLGAITGTRGVHGIAIASELGHGYTSNGHDDTVSVFDLATLKTLKTVKVGHNPDAILYLPALKRLLTFNGRSHDISVIDATSDQVLATVAVGGRPEFGQVGAMGEVFFTVEDTNEIAVLDPRALTVRRRITLQSCDAPSGLAVDSRQRLYAVCQNQTLVVSSPDGATQHTTAIGHGPDGVVWMDGLAFSADGDDAVLSVVGETPTGDFVRLAKVPTEPGARTIAADPRTHRLYLPTAALAPSQPGTKARRTGLPGSFHILVLEARAPIGMKSPAP